MLTCRAFAAAQPVERQTWRIRIGPTGAQALREHPRLGLEFTKDSFSLDLRLDGMVWDRPRSR
ncbi:MAG: hypothetical protein Q8K20_19010 [Gemmobacter sp.]|nr:hypothetical protein [Gemmobacter sp.]